MSHLLHYLPTTLANNELTHYKLVKYQHDYIFHLIKLLRDKIRTHISTEESLINYKNETTNEILINHNDLLEKLDSIKEEFKTHIKLYDNFHNHKL
tara:strand:+ start:598 stop:885 length:288 start_codon:yes stop_codon:yes gene_type:complete